MNNDNERVNELLSLIAQEWQGPMQTLNLVTFLQQMAEEIGLDRLTAVNDDQLIYHLKMRALPKNAPIPGMVKEFTPKFENPLLGACRTPIKPPKN